MKSMNNIHINFLIRKIGDGHAVQGNKEKLFVGENSFDESLKFVESEIKKSIDEYKSQNKT